MKNIIIIILATFGFDHAYAGGASSSLIRFCQSHDTTEVVLAALKNNFAARSYYKKFEHYFDKNTHMLMIDGYLSKGNLLSQINHEIVKLPSKTQKEIFKSISRWLIISDSLETMGKNFNTPFEEALYNIPSTKPLFGKYITNHSLQTWSSLSTLQDADLYVDAMNYLIGLSDDRLDIFYRQYMAKLKEFNE